MKQEHDGKLRNRKVCKQFEGQGSPVNAKKAHCCAWYQLSLLEKHDTLKDESFCGLSKDDVDTFKAQGEKNEMVDGVETDIEEVFREPCCVNENKDTSTGDCDNFDGALGPAHEAMLSFASSNQKFYKGFLQAWKLATENGWTTLQPLK